MFKVSWGTRLCTLSTSPIALLLALHWTPISIYASGKRRLLTTWMLVLASGTWSRTRGIKDFGSMPQVQLLLSSCERSHWAFSQPLSDFLIRLSLLQLDFGQTPLSHAPASHCRSRHPFSWMGRELMPCGGVAPCLELFQGGRSEILPNTEMSQHCLLICL